MLAARGRVVTTMATAPSAIEARLAAVTEPSSSNIGLSSAMSPISLLARSSRSKRVTPVSTVTSCDAIFDVAAWACECERWAHACPRATFDRMRPGKLVGPHVVGQEATLTGKARGNPVAPRLAVRVAGHSGRAHRHETHDLDTGRDDDLDCT